VQDIDGGDFLDFSPALILMIAAGAVFVFYLIRTRQFKWLFRVIKNAAMGVVGILAGNFVMASLGLAVGINVLTVLVVGLLGLPGLLLLYVVKWIA
jgi:inhibitor of the pro-sigma K processing machinery